MGVVRSFLSYSFVPISCVVVMLVPDLQLLVPVESEFVYVCRRRLEALVGAIVCHSRPHSVLCPPFLLLVCCLVLLSSVCRLFICVEGDWKHWLEQ